MEIQKLTEYTGIFVFLIYMFTEISYCGKTYCVMTINFKKHKLPVVFDGFNKNLINSAGNKWKCNSTGTISCDYKTNGEVYHIKMHDIVIAADNKRKLLSAGETKSDDNNFDINHIKMTWHINRMGLDNRIENLICNTQRVSYGNNKKNCAKKKRTIKLPDNCGISPDELPTYIWYMKPEGTHGERFVIRIANIVWKSTSSKSVSLRYKLEEAKLYLNQMILDNPHIFNKISMNGECSTNGCELLKSFYDIIYLAGFTNFKRTSPIGAGSMDRYLCPKILSPKETIIFDTIHAKYSSNTHHPEMGHKKMSIKILPLDNELDVNTLPKYCYYRPATKSRGDYFMVQKSRNNTTLQWSLAPRTTWMTSSSKKISTKEKYSQLMNYISSSQCCDNIYYLKNSDTP